MNLVSESHTTMVNNVVLIPIRIILWLSLLIFNTHTYTYTKHAHTHTHTADFESNLMAHPN